MSNTQSRLLGTAAVAAVLWVAIAAAFGAPEIKLFVAPNGNDHWSGKALTHTGADGPFATLARARDEIRKLRVGGKLPAPVTVYVRSGTYEMPQPLTLGPKDSGTADCPVTYRSYEKQKVLLEGARRVTGFKPWRGKILQCDLKGTPLAKVTFHQLFFKGERQILARYPNLDPKDPHGGVWAHVLSAPKGSRTTFAYTPDVEKHWTNVQRAQVCIHPDFDWAWNIIHIKSVDRQDGTITLAHPTSYDLKVGDRYYVQNLLEELDSPGEWYLDPDKAILYFWPPSDLAGGDVMAPVMDNVIDVEKGANITLRGFTIEACDGDAVKLENCENCRLAASVVRNCGAWGVRIEGGHNTGAFGNDIYATGAGGIMLNGGDRATLTPGHNYATDNYIHHIAVFARTYNTGININGVGNHADHNLIHDTPHAGMTLGGNDNVVEYNIVHHTNLDAEDSGGIYFCSRDWTQRGNVIRYNIFHNCGGFGKDNSWMPVHNGVVGFSYPHESFGIYLDDPTTGTLVYGNVLWDVPICGLENHGGRDNTWENNIIVNAPALSAGMLSDNWTAWPAIFAKLKIAQKPGSPYLTHYPELAAYNEQHPAAMTGLKVLHNIFYYTAAGTKWLRDQQHGAWGGGQLLYSYSTQVGDFAKNDFDYNLVSPAPGIPVKIRLRRAPEATKLLSWNQWQALGMGQHSLVADPMFVDPAHHDYRLKPDSPALKLGFKQIPMDKIGPYQDPLRASWPIVEAPGAAALGNFTTHRVFKLPGYERTKAQEFVPRDGAGNFFAKLAAKQPVKVAYFGGGIHPANGWRAQVMKWLHDRYPGVQIQSIDASINDCVRGSGFSVYRFGQDVLAQHPDLVLVDFASDDWNTDVTAIWQAVEGIVRQAREADPHLDVIFLYAFRDGFQKDYAEGLSPMTVSAYERIAEHYGIPAINMGYRVAELARQGKLVIKGKPGAAKGKLLFSTDGVRPTADGNAIYAQVITEALGKLAQNAQPVAHPLPKPFRADNLEQAKLAPITPDMLSGDWQKLPADNVGGSNFSHNFREVWYTKTPGAKLTFKFKGTAASLFDLIGPDTGRVKVTVDGKDAGTRQQVDQWAYYQRLAAMNLASGLPEGVHTVTIELLPEVPDRSAPIASAKKLNRYKAEDYQGVALRIGWIRLIGDLVQ